MSKSVCVFSASSERVDDVYLEAAGALGALIAQAGWTLIFGGGMRGLMGAAARGAHAHGGHVIGVIPDKLNVDGVVYEAADELLVTDTLRERKHEMDERSDAFIALPGGFGTLEEIIEALALKQLGYHNRALVFLNISGFYDDLITFFDGQVSKRFVMEQHQRLYYVANTPDDAVRYIEGYAPERVPDKVGEEGS